MSLVVATGSNVGVVVGILVAILVLTAIPVGVSLRRRGRRGAPPTPPARPAPPGGRAPTAPLEVGAPPAEPPAAPSGTETQAPPQRASPAPAGAPPVEVVPASRRFRERLARSRVALAAAVSGLLSRGADDAGAWDELEESLVAADVGVATATELVDRVRVEARAQQVDAGPRLRDLLREALLDAVGREPRRLDVPDRPSTEPSIVLIVGVNGTGKTTTTGKLALSFREQGHEPLIVAADTFRAAATDQLALWAQRVGAPLVRQQHGADPAAVAFDGLAAARARRSDVILVDTAGRLHSKVNLMEELKKIRRVLEREGGQVREVLLVLDATTGQNGLVQAREFRNAVGVTGLVLTKLDGTARGGIVVAVQRDLGIPVKLVGLGEGPQDLAEFDPAAFVDALIAADA